MVAVSQLTVTRPLACLIALSACGAKTRLADLGDMSVGTLGTDTISSCRASISGTLVILSARFDMY
jgi:hypothetical protein